MTGRDDIKAVLTKAFNTVDTDGNGYIDSTEIKAVLSAYYQNSKKSQDPAKIEEDANVSTFTRIKSLLFSIV